MTNLTQPRYLVIADYPNNAYSIGSIIKQISIVENSIYYDGRDNGMHTIIRHPAKYPHLFRLLHWWEFRDEKDMPEYVKGFGNQIYKVHKWKKLTKNVLATVLEDTIEYQFNASSCNPATLSEYNEYIKNK